MSKKIWQVELEDGSHTIEINHSFLKKIIIVDGVELLNSKEILDFGGIYPFKIGQHQCFILIKFKNALCISYVYDLYIDWKSVTTDETIEPVNELAFINIKQYERDEGFKYLWQELGLGKIFLWLIIALVFVLIFNFIMSSTGLKYYSEMVIRRLSMMHFYLWLAGYLLADCWDKDNHIKIQIPGWLSRILFIKKLDGIPIFALVLQIWVYILAIVIIFSFYYQAKDIIRNYPFLWRITIYAIGLDAIWSTIIYYINKRKNTM